jgi:hypothetical protein
VFAGVKYDFDESVFDHPNDSCFRLSLYLNASERPIEVVAVPDYLVVMPSLSWDAIP